MPATLRSFRRLSSTVNCSEVARRDASDASSGPAREPTSPRRGTWGAAPGVDRAFLALTAALTFAAIVDLHGAVRLVLALGFVCFVPGWALLAGRGPTGLADRLALSVVLGLAVSTLVTTLAVWLRLWHPGAIFALLAVPSAAVLRIDLRRASPRPARPDRRVWRSWGGDGGLARPAWRRVMASFRASDAPLLVAFALWLSSVGGINPRAMSDYGLIPALPVAYFVALALLVISFVWELSRPAPSPVRLAVQVVTLVLMLHATVPLVFPEPRYAWVYKHLGVVNYINLHGSLNPGVDIYQNWPGFFALGAWFTKLAGVGSPLTFAAWAQVVFNLLFALELGFAFRSVRVPSRARWLGLFLFVAANWVAQDYFAPQAFAFLLSLGLFGVLLRCLGRPPALAAAIAAVAKRLLRSRDSQEGIEDTSTAIGLPVVAVVVLLFAAMAVSHQLSPFIVLSGIAVLTVAGLRPRWLVLALVAPAIGYLALRFAYVTEHYNLLGPLGRLFDNTHNASTGASHGEPYRHLIALAARALSGVVWLLAGIGVVRLLRQGQRALTLAALAAAPASMLVAQDYGGEAIYRVFLFSLPWCALLTGVALAPDRPWSRWRAFGVGAVLTVVLALFLPAYFGLEEVNQIRSEEVAASQYFYDHAPTGAVLMVAAPNFPVRVGARYDEFRVPWAVEVSLTNVPWRSFRHRMLGTDLEGVAAVLRAYEGSVGRGYIAISRSEIAHSRVFGLLPEGSLESLDRALGSSPDWRLFYRSGDAAIYELLDQDRGPWQKATMGDRFLTGASEATW